MNTTVRTVRTRSVVPYYSRGVPHFSSADGVPLVRRGSASSSRSVAGLDPAKAPQRAYERVVKVAAPNADADTGVFDRCILLCDEAHNLLPSYTDSKPRTGCNQRSNKEECDVQYDRTLLRIRNATKGCEAYFFSATPAYREGDFYRMMDLVKGDVNSAKGNEGFVVWYMERPTGCFADYRVQHIKVNIADPVELQGANHLQKYITRRGGYTGPCYEGGGKIDDRCDERWARYETFSGTGSQVTRASAQELAPKVYRVCKDVIANDVKTAILVYDKYVYKVYERVLGEMLQSSGRFFAAITAKKPPSDANAADTRAFKEQVMRENATIVANFNGIGGTVGAVLLMPSETYSEGVSLRNVKRLVIADIQAGLQHPSWVGHSQRIGRAIRLCSHTELPLAERVVDVALYYSVAEEVPGSQPGFRTLDQEKYELLQRDRDVVQTEMCRFEGVAVDGFRYYGGGGTEGIDCPLRLSGRPQAKPTAAAPAAPDGGGETPKRAMTHEEADRVHGTLPFDDAVFLSDYPDWYFVPTSRL